MADPHLEAVSGLLDQAPDWLKSSFIAQLRITVEEYNERRRSGHPPLPMKRGLTVEPFDPNPEPDQALLPWAQTVELLLRLPTPLRARAISGFADRVRCYADLRQGSSAIQPWQIRSINRLLGFQVIPVPQRHWRFGSDYRALRIIGGETGS